MSDSPPAGTELLSCRGCGKRLALAPLGWGEPSIDAVNLSKGVALCQSCLLKRLQAAG